MLTGHPSKDQRQGCRYKENKENLYQIGKRCWIFIGMCRVCIEKSSSVGTKLFYRFLGGYRPHWDCLRSCRAVPCGLDIRIQILDDTLGNEHEGKNESYRQKDVKGTASHIHPEVAYPVGRLAGDSPHHCNRYADACSCGKEVLDCKTGHLGKIACCRFTTVDLPVCVSDKTGSSVDCKVKIKSPEFLRVERKKTLKKKKYEEELQNLYH